MPSLPILPADPQPDAAVPRQPGDAGSPPAGALAARPDLLGLHRDELATALGPLADRSFRIDQIYRALYARGVRDPDQITSLPKALREELRRSFRIGIPAVGDRHRSADGTTKYALRLADGAVVEAVDIPETARRTFCISSQAGCAMGCRFCVTGFWGAGRDLTAGEIVGQVLALAGGLETGPTNVVFMGMGEPLLNVDAVERSVALLAEWISLRRITVSTVGVVPGIERLAAWPRRPNLAISLHAPDDDRRSALMPVNRAYPLAELMAALHRFPLEPGRKLTFEYLLIAGFNDAAADADLLVRRLAGLRAKVNLIPVNPDPVLGDRMVPPAPEVVDAFAARLRRRGLVATVRRRRGDDVSAACGQLRAVGRDPRGFRRSNLSW